MSRSMSDKVNICGLQANAIIGLDHWKKPVAHPVSIDVDFHTDFSKASQSDNLHYSLNYAVISDKIHSGIGKRSQFNFASLGGLANYVFGLLGPESASCEKISVRASAPKVDIRAPVSFESCTGVNGVYKIHGLRALTLIGVFTFERLNKQYVSLDIELSVPKPALNVSEVSHSVQEYLESVNFKTVEALVQKTSQWILQSFPMDSVSVRVTKPNAIVYTEGVGVSCFYTPADFEGVPKLTKPNEKDSETAHFDLPVSESGAQNVSHDVYVAFGSNVGDQVGNIAQALNFLDQHPQISVVSTSTLYISKPMYHLNQADFYNGVAHVKVSGLTPHELLNVLKDIEYQKMTRVKDFANGPRSIDLDIILFGDSAVTSPDLVVPHMAMLDRTFVLQPLCELIAPDFTHPVTAEPIHNHLSKLLKAEIDPAIQESSALVSYIPGSQGRSLKINHNGSSPTQLMGIFNATPDSFSDGGKNFTLSKTEIFQEVCRMKAQGATIIDIGGVSTRPGSSEPSEDEEIARVVPVVQTIRECSELDDLLISVDTYRANVAEVVLSAGADIINDISMGLYDPKIFGVVAKFGCGYVMNHTRGTPATMSNLTTYGPTENGLVEYNVDIQKGILPTLDDLTQDLINGVGRELTGQIKLASKQGVRKWQIIVDPGIGFAKNLAQNVAILRHGSRFKQYAQLDLGSGLYTSFHGMTMLMGPSRKKFLGTLTGEQEAKNRVLATASSVVACVEQGADIVRVHDVREMNETLKVADAIYKGIC